MDTDKHRLLFKDETHQIIGSAIELVTTLGMGYRKSRLKTRLCQTSMGAFTLMENIRVYLCKSVV